MRPIYQHSLVITIKSKLAIEHWILLRHLVMCIAKLHSFLRVVHLLLCEILTESDIKSLRCKNQSRLW